MMVVAVQPAVLARTPAEFRRRLAVARAVASGLIHIDIMDKGFVPKSTVRPQVLKTPRGLKASYHVMAFHPERYLDDLRRAGAREIIVHVEGTKKPAVLAAAIHRMGLRFGLAINPRTQLRRFRNILRMADTVLVMSVQPGFSGQRFRRTALAKVRAARRMAPNARIGIDGGINPMTAALAARSGVDFVCAASAIFAADEPKDGYRALVRAVRDNGNHKRKGKRRKKRD